MNPMPIYSPSPMMNNDVTEEACAQHFVVSTRNLFDALKSRVPVEKRTRDVFTHQIQQEMNFSAELSPERAAREAQNVLLKNKTFDPRELRRALLRKLALVMREESMAEANDPRNVGYFLDVILATHRELLYEAQKAAHAVNAEISEAEDLPDELMWAVALPFSFSWTFSLASPSGAGCSGYVSGNAVSKYRFCGGTESVLRDRRALYRQRGMGSGLHDADGVEPVPPGVGWNPPFGCHT